MYLFVINTIDAFGQKNQVRIQARSTQAALEILRSEGYRASEKDIVKRERNSLWNRLKKIDFESKFSRVPKKDILRLVKMIGNSLSRGRTLKESLDFIGENEDNKALKKVVLKMKDKMSDTFSSQTEIFGIYPQYFDEEFLGIIQAGETSSNLGEYLLDYVEEKKKQMVLTNKFHSVLMKRVTTFLMVVVVIVIVVVFVIPQFKALFGEKMEVPWAMGWLLNLSNFFKSYGVYILITMVASISLFIYFDRKNPKFRWWWHDLLLRIPVMGKTLRTFYTAQFSHLLSSLLTKNVDIITSIQIIRRQTRNVCLKQTYQNLIDHMKSGHSLFEGVIKENDAGRDYLISSIVQAAKVGGATASLGATLKDVRMDLEELFEVRLERAIKVFSIIFYAFILGCALFTAYAIGSGILSFYENAQNLV